MRPGCGRLCRTLVRMKVELVAIERPDGLLVERLLDAGLRMLPLHPNQVAAARPRFRVSGGKSDRFDAFVLCELARTDHHRFRVLEPDSDQTKALRALTRAREDLVADTDGAHQPAARRARALLAGTDRTVQRICDSPISLAFLKRYPSPHGRHGRSARSACRGSWPASTTPAASNPPSCSQSSAARPRAAPASLNARPAARSCSRWSRRSSRSSARSSSSSARSRLAVREHPDGEIFLSLFKRPDSVISAADLLAEIGDCRARYPTRDALAGDAGQAAVAIESGKRKAACFRWACNKRLRDAFCTLADSTRHWHPWAADHYARASQRGHDHQRAIRTLGRAWCRIVWQLLARPHPV